MFDARTALRSALAAGALIGLQACDNGPSAVAQRPSQAPQAFASAPVDASREETSADARTEPVRQLAGKPLWSASRRYNAEENAQRAFDRNGEAFGASSVDDFARQAHAFIDRPPAGVLKLTRANGDVLLYDPKTNVFAVANREGAPRTMFKPDDGMTYWEEQKTRESRRQTAARNGAGGDEG